jgi:hypothetical protein
LKEINQEPQLLAAPDYAIFSVVFIQACNSGEKQSQQMR